MRYAMERPQNPVGGVPMWYLGAAVLFIVMLQVL